MTRDAVTTALEHTLPTRRNGSPAELPLARSRALLEQAKELVPGLTQSMMKRPEAFAPGSFPVYLRDGRGAVVTDVDGNTYIDFICGLGANTLGHNHPAVVSAIQEALPRGILHSLPTEIELDATRILLALTPNADMARFFKTGADATSAAVRLARHATGKEKIITVGYNGWHDHFMYDTPGVPRALRDHTLRLPLMAESDEAVLLARVAEHAAELAAVVLSVPYNRALSRAFVHTLRATCKQHGVLFVFDEVVTGFRLARGGAQEFYGVDADLICLSKGIAAGMPLSAVAGLRPLLSRMTELQVSTTFGGELLSLAVCKATLEVYRDTNYIEHIAALGRRLRAGVNARSEALGTPLRIRGYDAIPFFAFAPDMPTQAKLAEPFVGAMARRGVILRRDVNFLSAVHSEAQIDYTIDACGDALSELRSAGVFGGVARAGGQA